MRYNPEDFFVSSEYTEDICIVDEFQRRGTIFPLNIEAKNRKQKFFALLDTGAMRSCMTYSMFCKLNLPLLQQDVPRVVGADGGDLWE